MAHFVRQQDGHQRKGKRQAIHQQQRSGLQRRKHVQVLIEVHGRLVWKLCESTTPTSVVVQSVSPSSSQCSAQRPVEIVSCGKLNEALRASLDVRGTTTTYATAVTAAPCQA